MAGKNKAGREAKKPKQSQNTKVKGQTPVSVKGTVPGLVDPAAKSKG